MTMALNGTSLDDLYLNGTICTEGSLNGAVVFNNTNKTFITVGSSGSGDYGYRPATYGSILNPSATGGLTINNFYSDGSIIYMNTNLQPFSDNDLWVWVNGVKTARFTENGGSYWSVQYASFAAWIVAQPIGSTFYITITDD